MQNRTYNKGNQAQDNARKPDYIANAVREDEKSQKTYWTRIGVAFRNQKREDGTDGGYTILLNAVPTNGKLILTVPLDDKEQ